MYKYNILESDSPASAEQLSELGTEDGWRLKFILQYNSKFYYHLIREEISVSIPQYEYRTLKASSPMSKEQLEEFANEGWVLQSIIWWEDSMHYYLMRSVIPKKSYS